MDKATLAFLCRFMKKVSPKNKSGNGDPCWIWEGALNAKGYGIIHFQGKTLLAHRFLWSIIEGAYPSDDKCVCHHCDIPCCVNPAHLFLGSHADNMKDMKLKGRNKFRSRLSVSDVRAVRRLHATGAFSQTELSKKFSVRANTINAIVRGLSWKGLKDAADSALDGF